MVKNIYTLVNICIQIHNDIIHERQIKMTATFYEFSHNT